MVTYLLIFPAGNTSSSLAPSARWSEPSTQCCDQSAIRPSHQACSHARPRQRPSQPLAQPLVHRHCSPRRPHRPYPTHPPIRPRWDPPGCTRCRITLSTRLVCWPKRAWLTDAPRVLTPALWSPENWKAAKAPKLVLLVITTSNQVSSIFLLFILDRSDSIYLQDR
jgi:hypothetical protein